MKMLYCMRNVLICNFLLFLSSCFPAVKSPMFFNDIDSEVFWNENSPASIVKDPNASSGLYVVRLDSIYKYSPTFQSALNELPIKPSKVVLGAKIKYITGNPKLKCVVEIKDNNRVTYDWLNVPIKVDQLSNKWQTIKASVDLTQDSHNNEGIIYRIYFMNDSPDYLLLDDLSIDFK
jgi:hypothetical protein